MSTSVFPTPSMWLSPVRYGSTRRWYLRRVLPYRTGDNHIDGVGNTLVDITDRKALERERYYSRLVEDLPVGAVYVQGGQIVVNTAAERITGYTRAELST